MEVGEGSSSSPPAGDPAVSTVQATPDTETITLKILSPSTEIPNEFTLVGVSPGTTIGELKRQIQATAPSRPSVDRQRLIHRGRLLAQESDTIKDVFGQDLLDNSGHCSLHLVLRPLTSDPPSTFPSMQANVPPNQFNNPSSTTGTPQPGYSGVQQTLQPGSNLAAQSTTTPQAFPNAHIPNQQLQDVLRESLGALNQQQRAMSGLSNGLTNLQQIIAQQQQQARAAFGFQGQGNTANGMNISNINNPALQTAGQGPFNILTREGIGPNGERWHVSINEGTRTLHNPSAMPGPSLFPPTNSLSPVYIPTIQDGHTVHGLALQDRFPNTYPQRGEQIRMIIRTEGDDFGSTLARVYQQLDQLEGHTAAGRQAPDADIQLAQDMVNALTTRHHAWHDTLENNVNARLQSLREGRIRGDIRSQPPQQNQASASPQISVRTPPIHPIPGQLRSVPSALRTLPVLPSMSQRMLASNSTPSHISSDTVVYLLSSPSGPQAVLLSPEGTYSSAFNAPGRNIPAQEYGRGADHPQVRLLNQQIREQQPVQAGLLPGGQALGDAAALNANQPNPVRDFVRVVLPLGGHIWLLIRLMGFVLFFTSGAGWRRTILFMFAAAVVFAAQTGLFDGLQRAVFDPVRRHLEGLVPLADDRNRRPQQGDPDPREAAERLLRERRERDGSWLRGNARRVERAVVLFLASLVPGVGERHVAAREEAEAVRQVAEAERRERAEGQAGENADDQARPADRGPPPPGGIEAVAPAPPAQ